MVKRIHVGEVRAASRRGLAAAGRRSVGLAAEQAVKAWLEARAVRVLGVNVRVGYLEVDLVVLDGRTVALVEVRTRGVGAWTSAFGSIDGWKRTRIRRAADRLWHRRFRYEANIDHIRCDVASVAWVEGQPRIEYVKSAF